ncbi:hypothetical protein NW768_008290 [Fusarium equiseti]|uniref:Thioesterase domain-containing protein n=1 Tax=Fusarium equiseti TaxID=61235 RepID=A0ABQ8R6K3_FUSEQ|nr:hypothetical protein NW768_008290 [Fusarium equiseti]
MDTTDDEIYIPRDFIESVQSWDDIFKQLQDGNEWVERIDKELSDSDLSILRHAFLMDGHNFMSTLTQYLHAVKWQEFVAHICTHSVSVVPVLMHLLFEGLCSYLGGNVPEPASGSFHNELDKLKGSELFDSGCVEAIRNRTGFTMRRSLLKDRVEGNWKGIEFAEVGYLNQLYQAVKKEKDHFAGLEIVISTDMDVLIAEVEDGINRIDSTHADDMTFGYHIISPNKGEPDLLSLSKRWTTIGRNICRLGLRVGADVPRSPTQCKRTTIITALKAIINNEGPAVNIMLSRLEKYQVQIQKQQQVITALQFRHLMEHLPIGVRDQWLAAASSKVDEVSKASRWDRMKEVEKWQEFWLEAVKQIFRAYKKNGREAVEGSEGHEPSPFANLLKYHLARAGEKEDERDAVQLLANETDVGERVKRLYNTLSQIIHQYSDANFEVNRLNFSPLDAQILAALVPKESRNKAPDDEDRSWDPVDKKGEIIVWKKEFRRYVWESVTPAASTRTQADPSNEGILVRVKGLWSFLGTKFPSAELFPKNRSISTATFDEANLSSSVTAKFTLAKKHINSCGMIHGAVLAALLDAVGRMALLTAGRCVVNGRVGVNVESSFVATAGDEIHVTGLMARGEEDQSYCTMVSMKTANDTMVASGSFKVWEVRETEDGEAFDSMV